MLLNGLWRDLQAPQPFALSYMHSPQLSTKNLEVRQGLS